MHNVLESQKRTLDAQDATSQERRLRIQKLDQQIANERQQLASNSQKLENIEQSFALLHGRILTIQQHNAGHSATEAKLSRQTNIDATVANEKAENAFVMEIIRMQSQIAQLSGEFQPTKVEESCKRCQAELSGMLVQLEAMIDECATAEKNYQDQQTECKNTRASLQATDKWLQDEATANNQMALKAEAKLQCSVRFDAEQESNVAIEQQLIETLEKDIELQEKRSKHNSDGAVD